MAISKPVRDALRARLADTVQGFNPRHAAAAEDAGVAPISIDWTANSKQFLQAFLSPDQLEESSDFRYPLVCLYTVRAANRNRAKYHQFSGEVHAYVDVHLSWANSKALRDSETALDIVEDVLVALFNARDWQGSWEGQLAYNGDIQFQRMPVVMDGRNWRQTLCARLIFEVDSDD